MISYSFISGSWKVYKKENTDWVVSFSGTEAPLIELFFQISYTSIGFFILSVFIASVATWQQISKSQRNFSDDTNRLNNAKQDDQVKSTPGNFSLGKVTVVILCMAAVVVLNMSRKSPEEKFMECVIDEMPVLSMKGQEVAANYCKTKLNYKPKKIK